MVRKAVNPERKGVREKAVEESGGRGWLVRLPVADGEKEAIVAQAKAARMSVGAWMLARALDVRRRAG